MPAHALELPQLFRSCERLAGVFSAAPSVAVGSLAVVVLASGERDGLLAAKGMVVGVVALVGACLVGALVARPVDGSALPISAAHLCRRGRCSGAPVVRAG